MEIAIRNILNRMQAAAGVKTDIALAEKIGMKQSSIASWIKRDTLDLRKIMQICDDQGWGFYFILTGEQVSDEVREWRDRYLTLQGRYEEAAENRICQTLR